MRIYRYILLSLMICFTFSGCIKKGDEDPLFSIYKRSKRIQHNWTLKELAYQHYDVDANGKVNVVIRTMTRDEYTETRGVDSVTKTFIGTMKATLSISADTYTYDESVITNGITYNYGQKSKPWSWNDNTKKTGLILSDFKSFDITGLHDNELVLTITDINTLNAIGSHSYIERWVFKQ